MARHTPRPWRIEDGTTLIWGNCDPDDLGSYGMGYPIMNGQQPRSWRRDHPTDDEIEANCRLVAAAPDLLAACRALLDNYGPPATIANIVEYPAWHPITKARAAIAKAEGSTNAPPHD